VTNHNRRLTDIIKDDSKYWMDKMNVLQKQNEELLTVNHDLNEKILHQSEQITKITELIENEISFMHGAMLRAFMKLITELKSK